MKYRTKITVRAAGKTYEPGEILPADISGADLAFLKSKKFVEPVDSAESAYEEPEDPADEDGEPFDGFDEIEPGALKSAEEIQKIRSKKDVAAYAAQIGLDLGDYEGKGLKELQAAVINFQEEQMENGADE